MRTESWLFVPFEQGHFVRIDRESGEHAEQLRKWFIAPLLHATNLREVSLSFGFENYVRSTALLDVRMRNKLFRHEFPFWLENCKALSKLSVKFFSTDLFGNAMMTEPFKSVVKRITARVGVEGHFEEGAWI